MVKSYKVLYSFPQVFLTAECGGYWELPLMTYNPDADKNFKKENFERLLFGLDTCHEVFVITT